MLTRAHSCMVHRHKYIVFLLRHITNLSRGHRQHSMYTSTEDIVATLPPLARDQFDRERVE